MNEKHSVHESEVENKDYSDHYPQSILSMGGAKVLIGPDGAITNHEISMAVMEINPGRIYPLHSHEAPEVYYVLEGKAKCTWGTEEFQAGPGTAIQTRPGTPLTKANERLRPTGPGTRQADERGGAKDPAKGLVASTWLGYCDRRPLGRRQSLRPVFA